MGFDKLDLILQKMDAIEQRLEKLENNTDEINTRTEEIHSQIPFVDFLKSVADNISSSLGYIYPSNLKSIAY
jgi:prefoldin subunit 5